MTAARNIPEGLSASAEMKEWLEGRAVRAVSREYPTLHDDETVAEDGAPSFPAEMTGWLEGRAVRAVSREYPTLHDDETVAEDGAPSFPAEMTGCGLVR